MATPFTEQHWRQKGGGVVPISKCDYVNLLSLPPTWNALQITTPLWSMFRATVETIYPAPLGFSLHGFSLVWLCETFQD